MAPSAGPTCPYRAPWGSWVCFFCSAPSPQAAPRDFASLLPAVVLEEQATLCSDLLLVVCGLF